MRKLFKILFILLLAIIALTSVVTLFMRQERFGKIATGDRLKRIQQSSNYREGQFQNQQYTPMMAEDVSTFATMKDALLNRSKRNRPSVALPSVKTNLHALAPDKEALVWFGHSSYFMQLGGKKILVDPVFSGHSSPFSFMVKSFKGSDIYTPDEMPLIDYLFITHDHWDHLDYETMLKLKQKVKKVIVSLGTAAHLERWGFDMATVIELDWQEQAVLDSGFIVTAVPARHFSGRGLKRNQAIWASYVFQTPGKKIFIGGDSGYDSHFADIGQTHGPFNLALLECGQYNYAWRYIHMMPEQTAQAAIDLKAHTLMPVHWGKFALALHAWDEPILRVTKEAKRLNMPIVHPMIGEELDLNAMNATTEWWQGIE